MITLKKIALAASVCAAGIIAAQSAFAQTTDAYHTIQIFPVVVDTASFTQRFTFRNPNATILSISPTYFPGTGTAQASAFTCPTILIAANSDKTFNTLREICPALAAGSNFGFLYTYEVNTANMPYSGFSRVANPQGNGFSVEAFAASNFTSGTSSVSGLRRLAASGGNPAFQTNCFVANLNDYVPLGSPVTTNIEVMVFSSTNVQLGTTTSFPLAPGKLTRLLDVFGIVGAPAGNHDNARARFYEVGTGEPAIMAFCTVQDNTSFGADFRIAKQEDFSGIQLTNDPDTIGPQDDSAVRNLTRSTDVTLNSTGTTPTTRTFEIGTGTTANTHVIYFRHPDWAQCEIIDPATGVRALNTYGLEMRLMADDGVTVVAGGSDSQGFAEVYLGDKRSRNAGANTRYSIEVESNGFNTGSARPYRIHCQSGSGSTQAELVRFQEATGRF
ncbi:MAG: hypothetical protein A3E01_10925 [Gammaproteobacteria bacterium RIFCSPHIGHO2_12_FULL_63_22]|nr:MAG: hypothetical protein A3E01_10925 [Gammaproteobacteria bacterium RIFCSPHIGHO2_12_FULL_63_22]